MSLTLREFERMCSEVRIEGLETLDYVDNLMNRSRFTEQADAITFDGEVGIIKHHINSYIHSSLISVSVYLVDRQSILAQPE